MTTIDDTLTQAQDGERLAELVLALDGWLSGGGFAPKKWAVMT